MGVTASNVTTSKLAAMSSSMKQVADSTMYSALVFTGSEWGCTQTVGAGVRWMPDSRSAKCSGHVPDVPMARGLGGGAATGGHHSLQSVGKFYGIPARRRASRHKSLFFNESPDLARDVLDSWHEAQSGMRRRGRQLLRHSNIRH